MEAFCYQQQNNYYYCNCYLYCDHQFRWFKPTIFLPNIVKFWNRCPHESQSLETKLLLLLLLLLLPYLWLPSFFGLNVYRGVFSAQLNT